MVSRRPGAAAGCVPAQNERRARSETGRWQSRSRLKPDGRRVGGIETPVQFRPSRNLRFRPMESRVVLSSRIRNPAKSQKESPTARTSSVSPGLHDRRTTEIAHVLAQRDSVKSYWEGFSPNW